jgi:hypothetical protein
VVVLFICLFVTAWYAELLNADLALHRESTVWRPNRNLLLVASTATDVKYAIGSCYFKEAMTYCTRRTMNTAWLDRNNNIISFQSTT